MKNKHLFKSVQNGKIKKDFYNLTSLELESVFNKTKEKGVSFNSTISELLVENENKMLANIEKLRKIENIKNDPNNKTTTFVEEQEWLSMDNERYTEQYMSMTDTNIFKNMNFNDAISKHIAEWRNFRNKESETEVYQQVFLEEGFTFSHWLTLNFMHNISEIFNYYEKVKVLLDSGSFKQLNNNLIEYGFQESSSMDYILYDVEKETLVINHNYKSIYFIFKRNNLRTQKLQVPGFNILYKRFLKSEFNKDKNNKKQNYLQNDSVIKLKKQNNIFEIVSNISRLLNITPKEYLTLLFKTNNYVFCDSEGNPVFVNKFSDPGDLQKKKYKYTWTDTTKVIDVIIVENIRLVNSEKIPWSIIFMCSEPDLESGLMLYKNTVLGKWLLEFYLEMNKFGQPIRALSQESSLNNIEIQSNKKDENSIVEDVYLNPQNVFYGWESRGEETNKNFEIDRGLSNEDILKQNKENYTKIINKLRVGSITRKEIKWATSFFYYANKNIFQKSNIRVRNIFEIINTHRGKYLSFLDVLQARYGCSSSIICSMFFFTYHVKVSNTGQTILNDINLWYCSDDKWISIGKQISELVKTTNIYKGMLVSFDDFKNLQYIDTWLGPMGGDGKHGRDIVKSRLYTQNPKILLNFERKENNVFLADIICKKVFEQYWKKVIDKSLNTNVNFVGIYRTLDLRDVYSTESSGGGLQGQFDNKKIQEKLEPIGFMPKRANKKTVFESEDTEFFINVIFDIPKTLCDMIVKQKEMAKLRYIYSVTMDHYLVSSIVLYHLEPFLNEMGVRVRQDEADVLTHNVNYDHMIFNCIDYSEFNDQHEERHKKQVYESLSNVIKEKNLYGDKQLEYLLMVDWLKVACSSMLIRVESDNSTLYRHKGRLFSGERATTLINSMMSVFYYVLIICSMIEYDYYIHREGRIINIFENTFELKRELNKLLDGGKLEDCDYINDLISKNVCLGDDGKSVFSKVIQCVVFNEMAIMCGLMLKLSKCLIGLGMSEFLRKIEVKTTTLDKITISKGYVNRGITSLVNGNPEGSDQKNYIGWITQIYEMLNTIKVRSEYSELLTHMFHECWNFISKLNQKNKEISNMSLPTWLLYVPKKQNGLGFVSFENTIAKIKVSLPKLLNPASFNRKYKIDIPTPALISRIENYSLARVVKYGKVNPKKLASRVITEKQNYLNANNNISFLYDEQFLLAFEKNLKFYYEVGNQVIFDKFGCDNIFISEVQKEAKQFLNALSSGQVDENQLTTSVERAVAFMRDLDLVTVNRKIKTIIQEEFGKYVYNMIIFKDIIDQKICSVDYIEPSAYNKCFSIFMGDREITEDNVFKYKILFELILKEISIF